MPGTGGLYRDGACGPPPFPAPLARLTPWIGTGAPPPWEAGWRFLAPGLGGDPPVSTRARGTWNGGHVPSLFYLHPRHLLFRPTADIPWDLMDPHEAGRQLDRLLSARGATDRYPAALDGLRVVLRWGRAPAAQRAYDPGDEAQAMDFGRWLLDQGRDCGVRPLTADERADATGHGTFLRDLGLAGDMLYDAVGMHFDPCCFQRRCYPLLRAWSEGCPPPPPPAIPPDCLERLVDDLRTTVRANLPFEDLRPAGIPPDVAAHLRAVGFWSRAAGATARPTARSTLP